MESYIKGFFNDEVNVEDKDFQKTVIDNVDMMFVDVAKYSNGAVAYYFRFDPAFSGKTDGLFYSKLNGSDEYTSLEPTDISLYEKDDTEHVGWFWEPYDAGKPVWMLPYYNKNNNIYMISYVAPLYHNGRFIGVVGIDFDYTVLADTVRKIKIYENGFAHLEIGGKVIHSDDRFEPQNYNSNNYLRVSEKLTNGMELVVSASYDDIRQIRYDIAFKILFIVLILAAFFIALAIYVVRRIVSPLKKITDASTKLSDGDYNVEFTHSDVSEIETLNTTFENMATKLHEREKELRLSANRDSLTGLSNTTSYKSWVASIDKEIANKSASFGVVVFDLNQLKETNDTYGHNTGDKLIIAAAKVISEVFKTSLVFRIGGDEFLAILQNTDLQNYEKLFEQFDVECARTFIDEDKQINVNFARGFAMLDLDRDLQFNDVFKRADNAMYENKRNIKKLRIEH